ncbi:MAG TPA: hypothetical protein ACFYDZ_00210 [Candidatus Brocadiaceae bacterium]
MSYSNNNSLGLDNLSDDSPTTRECTGFTQINNNVINNIKCGDAFLVWCYLYSKTPNWKTIKQNIRNVYGFGDAKIKKIFCYLRRANLIEYVQNKGAKGQYQSVQIRILTGKKFDKTQAWLDDAPVVQKPAPAVVHTNGNEGLRNTDITKDIKEHNTESICATDVTHESEPCAFNEFWNIYPIKKNKSRAKRIWDKKKLNKIAVLICNDVSHRQVNDSSWADEQFIPHPSTYLQNDRWTDAITINQPKASGGKNTGGDALSRVINKHLKTHGETYEQHGNTYNPLR